MTKNHLSNQSRYFNRVNYRNAFHPVIQAYAEPKLQLIGAHAPLKGRILDVGCGNGIFTVRLAGNGASVVGLDYSGNLLQQNPHKHLIRGDASRLPFDDDLFDVVFEANLLHHVADRKKVIQEMNRVSRRYMIILEPNRYNPIMAAFSLVVRSERGGLKSCVGRLKKEVRGCGCNVIACITTGMISQNNTPAVLVPWLRRFDRSIWWGQYIVMVAAKKTADSHDPHF